MCATELVKEEVYPVSVGMRTSSSSVDASVPNDGDASV